MEIMELETNKIREDNCEKCLNSLPLARAYIPFQRYNTTYPVIDGLKRGTVFPELDMPYKKADRNYKPKKSC